MSILGFEQHTTDLTFDDRRTVGALVTIVKECIGKDKALTNKKLRMKLGTLGHHTKDTKIRKLIHHIRVSGLVKQVVASSVGYYIATSKGEFLEYIESLNQRARSIDEVRVALEGQMNAPTPIPNFIENPAPLSEPMKKLIKQRAVAKKESNGWKNVW